MLNNVKIAAERNFGVTLHSIQETKIYRPTSGNVLC